MRRALLALGLALAGAAAHAACPAARDVRQQDLFGTWRAQIEGQPDATLLLARHPEYGGSFAGQVQRPGARSRAVGDLEKGEFLLEESIDGVRISATWAGQVLEGSCGREIRGTWQADGDDAPIVPFVLKKR
jgi:hypothetical protein